MKSVVHVSGGLDSAASLWLSCLDSEDVFPVFYDWDQPYGNKELEAAKRLVRDLRSKFPGLHRLCRFQIPLESSAFEPKEYVPYRNLSLVAHSLNLASAFGYDSVVVGCKSAEHRSGDKYSFLDSTAQFVTSINVVVENITEPNQKFPVVRMPLKGWTKARVVECLVLAGIDPKGLWTCYGPGPEPCGTCYHCKEFEAALHDPIVQAAMHRAIV